MHPDVQDRLVAELSSAGVPVGQGPESAAAVLLKSDTMKKLVFLQAVINESMRLFPAAGPASNRCGKLACAECTTTKFRNFFRRFRVISSRRQ